METCKMKHLYALITAVGIQFSTTSFAEDHHLNRDDLSWTMYDHDPNDLGYADTGGNGKVVDYYADHGEDKGYDTGFDYGDR
jgi:hypothetical protein